MEANLEKLKNVALTGVVYLLIIPVCLTRSRLLSNRLYPVLNARLLIYQL